MKVETHKIKNQIMVEIHEGDDVRIYVVANEHRQVLADALYESLGLGRPVGRYKDGVLRAVPCDCGSVTINRPDRAAPTVVEKATHTSDDERGWVPINE